MTISVITPTADQPTGIALLEAFLDRQTIKPDQWIVTDDGHRHAVLHREGAVHLKAQRTVEGGKSLAGNLLRALPAVTGDVVIIMEHDDWYAENHIEVCLQQLEGFSACGSKWQRYYNLPHRKWILMRNVGSALCNTAFVKDLLPAMEYAAHAAHNQNSYGVDRLFWDSLADNRFLGNPVRRYNIHEVNTVVGIKGLPGRPGLGMGHRPDSRWQSDPSLARLREWIGSDVELYEELKWT